MRHSRAENVKQTGQERRAANARHAVRHPDRSPPTATRSNTTARGRCRRQCRAAGPDTALGGITMRQRQKYGQSPRTRGGAPRPPTPRPHANPNGNRRSAPGLARVQ
eukprot:5325824-Prymnesium_polylepis.1